MDTAKILLKLVLENIQFIIPQVLIYISIMFVGFNIWFRIFKRKNLSLSVFAGSLLGLFVYMIYLSVFSYFFKGPHGILLITAIFFATGLLLSIKNITKLVDLNLSLNLTEMMALVIFILFTILMFFQISANIYGGDVIAYWGFATSFSNGNYPLMAPWQPDILANHHQSTYLVEGAVHALSKSDMKLVHSLYAYFVLISGVGLLWRYFQNNKINSIISILISIMIIVGLGGIYVLAPSFLQQYLNPEVMRETSRLPTFLDAKNRLGGASNLPDFIYINHRLASLYGIFLLTIIIISKNIKKKVQFFIPSLIAILSVVIISSDEGFLPAIGLIVIYWFVKQLSISKIEKKIVVIKKFLISGISFFVSFLLVGGAIRDSFLTPVYEEQRFGILHNINEIVRRFSEFRGVIFIPDYIDGFVWYMPHLFIVFLFALYFAKKAKSRFGNVMLVAALGSFIGNMLIDHTYYPSNNGRFLHMVYLFVTVSLLFNASLLLKTKSHVIKLLSIAIISLYLVTTIFSFVYIYEKAKQEDYPNLRGKLPNYQVLNWSKYNLPNNNIMFVDGFLRELTFSHLSIFGIQNFGLRVPVGPANYKVHTPDLGYEAIDVINTLNPSAIDALDVEYVYIEDRFLETFSNQRQHDLLNTEYFDVIYSDGLGKFYKINQAFINNGSSQNNSLEYLKSIIPSDSIIYIDWPPQMQHDMRSVLTLLFKNHKRVVTERRHGTFNLIETRIKIHEPTPVDKYDFVILDPETNIEEVCNCTEYESIWETFGAKAYKIKDEENK